MYHHRIDQYDKDTDAPLKRHVPGVTEEGLAVSQEVMQVCCTENEGQKEKPGTYMKPYRRPGTRWLGWCCLEGWSLVSRNAGLSCLL